MPLRPKSLHRSNASPKNITRAAAVVHIAKRSVSGFLIVRWRCVFAFAGAILAPAADVIDSVKPYAKICFFLGKTFHLAAKRP